MDPPRTRLWVGLLAASAAAAVAEPCLEAARHDRIELGAIEAGRRPDAEGFREVELADPERWHVLVRRGGWVRPGIEVRLVTPDADLTWPRLVTGDGLVPLSFQGRSFRLAARELGSDAPVLEVYGPDDGQPFHGELAGLEAEPAPGVVGPRPGRDALGGCVGIRPGARGPAPGIFLGRRELSFGGGRFAIVRFASPAFAADGRAGYLLLDRVLARWRPLWSAGLGPLDDVEGVLEGDRLHLRRVPTGPALFPEEGGPWLGRLSRDGVEPLIAAFVRPPD